ncbi:MAG: phosphate/phosphite/phosphonate ABC transporter substrate-binding protein [Gammaproteobacteria bacterium]|nr:phosphate/phosphite/phosphonate ABC transporter substrate-binding protein [Gammaproteobacteria bacterium]
MKDFWKTNIKIGISTLLAVFCTASWSAEKPLNLAILMPAPAKIIHKNWQPLADYLSTALGKTVHISTPRNLEQARTSLGDADFVYANAYLYAILADEFQITPIAQMRNTGNSVLSRGRFLVRNDSNITSIKDLKGKKIALISRFGAGSYLAPRASLAREGLDIEKDVTVEFTNNLKKAAYMVMLGEADTAVMCEVNYEILSKRIDTGDLKFFDTTEQFPEAIMFTPHKQDSEIAKLFKKAILADSARKNEALRSLNEMKIGNFIEFDPAIMIQLNKLIRQAGLTKIDGT